MMNKFDYDFYQKWIPKNLYTKNGWIDPNKYPTNHRVNKDFKIKNKIHYENIFKLTSFLPIDTKFKIRIMYITQNKKEIVLCEHCKINTVGIHGPKFLMFCSYKCQGLSARLKEQRRNTYKEKTGVEYSIQNIESQKKQVRNNTQHDYTEHGYIYIYEVLIASTILIKIGATKDFKRRLKELYKDYSVIKYNFWDVDKCFIMEKELLNHYDCCNKIVNFNNHNYYELFDIDYYQIKKEIEYKLKGEDK